MAIPLRLLRGESTTTYASSKLNRVGRRAARYDSGLSAHKCNRPAHKRPTPHRIAHERIACSRSRCGNSTPFTKLFPLPPVNPCQHPNSLPFAAPAPSPEHNHARYDSIYELTQVTQSSTTTESYSFDPVGNRTASLGVSSYTNNSSNELTSTSNASYTYDNNGNTLTKVVGSSTTQYFWDYENRMSSVTLPGSGGTVSFKYDPFGRRIYKSSSSATSIYAYDGDQLTEETNSSGAVVARYSQALNIDEPLAMLRSSTTSYYDADGLGSVTSLSNSAGSLSQTYGYDSFGKQTSSSGSLTNPFQYTARELDQETNLYYYRARYYDQNSGRFLAEDPIQFDGGINFYRYVGNDPAARSDPFGLSFLVFRRKEGTLSLYSADDSLIAECSAGNFTIRHSLGPWPNGWYFFGYHKNHPPDPNGPFGLYGIFVFKVPNRPGMGVHSGRANRKGPNSPTEGCVRTTDDCMKKMMNYQAGDPIQAINIDD